MTSFPDLALQYVLEEEDEKLSDIAQKAAQDIESAHASSTVVGTWASSIQPWMTGDDDNIIARAKALSFMASTLECLGKSTLRQDQVQFLCSFFGSMFANDHKAGIEASTRALRCLRGMKKFGVAMGVGMIEDVLRIQDDFSKQTAATRLQIYELLIGLIKDESIGAQIQHKYGESAGFVVDMLQLCQRERDPKNLLVWFHLLRTILTDYTISSDVTKEIFHAFSAYFPISLSKHASPAGISTDDLKSALRDCFSSHQRLAPFTFPFLLERLDKGESTALDVESVSAKVDLLRTIKACVDQYENPYASIVPNIDQIWTSLKFEVRHGEVKERIEATLDVLRAIAKRLDDSTVEKRLSTYLDLVFADCRNDLSNPTYTKQAGLLLVTVTTASIKAFVLYRAKVILTIRQNIHDPRTAAHKKDLFGILQLFLQNRQKLVAGWDVASTEDQLALREEAPEYLDELWFQEYAAAINDDESEGSSDALIEAVKGAGLLAEQQSLGSGQSLYQSCSREVYQKMAETLGHRLFSRLSHDHLECDFDETFDGSLDKEMVLALRTVVVRYRDGFDFLENMASWHLQSWPFKHSEPGLRMMREAVSRLAFIGCSQIPHNAIIKPRPTSKASPSSDIDSIAETDPFSSTQHLESFMVHMLKLGKRFPLKLDFLAVPQAHFIIVSGIYAAMLQFKDACVDEFSLETLGPHSKAEDDWTKDFPAMSLALSGHQRMLTPVAENDPQTYRGLLKLGLFTSRELYRCSLKATGTTYDDFILAQVAGLAAFTIRNLDEGTQKSFSLGEQVFRYFLTEDELASQAADKAQSKILLARGIAEGLWPSALAGLCIPDGQVESFLCDTSSLQEDRPAVLQTRAILCAILANKADPTTQPLRRVLDFWVGFFRNSSSSSESTQEAPAPSEAAVTVALHVTAGALARQDRAVLDMITALHNIIEAENPLGEVVARSVGILVKDMSFLNKESHGRVNKLYKQWVYSYFVKPLYQKAVPVARGPVASRFTTAILQVVEHCPYAAYQDDVEGLIRLVVTVLKTKLHGREVVSALMILHEVLVHEPERLNSHIKTIVSGLVGAYRESQHGAQADDRTHAKCRKKVLEVLGIIPGKFEQEIMAVAPEVQRMLAAASADPVRELRKLTLTARGTWARVA